MPGRRKGNEFHSPPPFRTEGTDAAEHWSYICIYCNKGYSFPVSIVQLCLDIFGSMRGQISLIFSRLLEFLVILSYTPLWWAVAVWILSDEARLTSYPTRDLYSSKTKTKESASYFRYPCGNVYCIHDFQDFIRFFIFSNLPYGSFMSFNQYLTAFTKN